VITGLIPAIVFDSVHRAQNDAVLEKTLRNVSTRYANFFAFEKHGAIAGIALHTPRLDSARGTSRDYFAPLMHDGGFRVGRARRSSLSNDSAMIVPLVRAVLDSASRPMAVIGTALRIDALGDLINIDMALPPQSIITILDTAGTIIARSVNGHREQGHNVFTRNPAASHTMPDSGIVEITSASDHITRLFSFAKAKSTPFIVNVGIPKAHALAPMYKEMERDLFAGTVTLFFAFLVALVLGGRIATPIDSLAGDARAIANGEEGRRTSINSASEVGVLATAFNQMADTVERRNAALAESERRYRLLFDSNPLPMFAWDAETLFILASNEAAQERYGYGDEEFLTRKVTDLLDPSEHFRFASARSTIGDRRLTPAAWVHRTATGDKIEMEVISTPSRRIGRPSWLSVSIDVTARHAAERALARSEEQLRQSQKMEAVGAFAGGIAHDFNNLLTGMLGYCELVLESLPAGSDDWNDVAEVKALAMRGADLTRQILTVSRKQVVQHTTLDVNGVVLSIDRLLRRLIGEHITLQSELCAQPTYVRTDASQLEQVLLNLASNARDSMQPGGTLTIRTAILSANAAAVHDLAPRDWVTVSVIDTGAGMTDEVRQRIFEPFFTTKERGKGTGLGLSLVYAMVEQSGGVVRVTSEPGTGALFVLYFPRSRDTVATEPTISIPARSSNGTELVLLAEDEDSVRAVAKEALERRGYRVLAAPDGPTALRIAREFDGVIDLLLTDVVMPGMNGRELAEALRRERPDTRVLFASGYTDDAVLLHGVRTDELSFIQKPFTPPALVQRVREVLDQPVRA
jgi:two-component system cell cycle sensor histidine kinase/response regulator CckA